MTESEFWRSAFLALLSGGRSLEQAQSQADRALEIWKKRSEDTAPVRTERVRVPDHVGVSEKPDLGTTARRGPGRPKKVVNESAADDAVDVEVSPGD
jgi:hypothetical protein